MKAGVGGRHGCERQGQGWWQVSVYVHKASGGHSLRALDENRPALEDGYNEVIRFMNGGFGGRTV